MLGATGGAAAAGDFDVSDSAEHCNAECTSSASLNDAVQEADEDIRMLLEMFPAACKLEVGFARQLHIITPPTYC